METASSGRVAGKVVLISGAASGMGASHVEFLVREGANVVVSDVQRELGEALVSRINAEAGRDATTFCELSVTSLEQWEAAVQAAVQSYGKLDALINNAGIPARGSVVDADVQEWNRAIDVNLTGSFYGMRAAVPELRKNETSSIVNVSSIAGLFGFKNRVAYSASKWAIHGLTKTSAMDFGPDGIRVNSIHPGSVNTPMTAGLKRGFDQVPLGRAADPQEVSPLVVYLVSDESRYVSGTDIAIDGGETAGNNMRPMN